MDDILCANDLEELSVLKALDHALQRLHSRSLNLAASVRGAGGRTCYHAVSSPVRDAMPDTRRTQPRNYNHRAVASATIIVWGCLLVWLHVAAAQPDALGPDKWPTTVEDTVRDLLSRMSGADKARVKSTKQEDLIQFHLGWGTGIRNHYGLWRGNEKLVLSACGHPCHPDDASMKIIEAVWQELQK